MNAQRTHQYSGVLYSDKKGRAHLKVEMNLKCVLLSEQSSLMCDFTLYFSLKKDKIINIVDNQWLLGI